MRLIRECRRKVNTNFPIESERRRESGRRGLEKIRKLNMLQKDLYFPYKSIV